MSGPVQSLGRPAQPTQVARKLAQLCAELGRFVAGAPDCCALAWDASDRPVVLAAAGHVEAILGARAEDLVGKPASALFAGGERAARDLALTCAAGPLSQERQLLRHGQGVPAQLTLRESDLGAVALVRDLTATQLEADAAVRAQELSRFASLVAHEVRNPLSAVKIALQTLERHGALGTNDRRRVTIANREVGSIEVLLTEVMEFARPPSLAMAPADPRLPVSEAVSAVEAEWAGRGVVFASKLPDEDVLPENIDPDPCRSPAQVRALPGVVIGRSLAKRLAVGLGDCLQITSPQIGMTFGASGARPPIAKQFRVIAVFEAGFDQYDSKLVYTDLYEAQAFYEQGDSVTGVEAKVDDIEHAADIAKEVDKVLANGVYHTMDWRELNHGLFTALLIQQIAMSVVLTLIIVVAAFTVIATLIMVVLDKKKEIALLKAIGASDDAILRVFLYQGGIIGVVGTALGLMIGWVGCKGLAAYGFPLDPKVYFISKLPVNVRPTEFLITGAVAIVICLVATIFPALYAARLRPSDGLRAE